MGKVKNQVLDLGEEVFKTPEFQEAYQKIHHKKSTIARHSIRVASASVAIAMALRLAGVKLDRKLLVTAALSHDLGMLKREEYSSKKEQYRNHPHDGAKVVEKRLGIHNEKLNNAIEAHMYPMNRKSVKPESKEAAVLAIADKVGSLGDILGKKQPPAKKQKEMKKREKAAGKRQKTV